MNDTHTAVDGECLSNFLVIVSEWTAASLVTQLRNSNNLAWFITHTHIWLSSLNTGKYYTSVIEYNTHVYHISNKYNIIPAPSDWLILVYCRSSLTVLTTDHFNSESEQHTTDLQHNKNDKHYNNVMDGWMLGFNDIWSMQLASAHKLKLSYVLNYLPNKLTERHNTIPLAFLSGIHSMFLVNKYHTTNLHLHTKIYKIFDTKKQQKLAPQLISVTGNTRQYS